MPEVDDFVSKEHKTRHLPVEFFFDVALEPVYPPCLEPVSLGDMHTLECHPFDILIESPHNNTSHLKPHTSRIFK